MAKNNIVSFGLRNVHYSKATQADDGTWSFAIPVALPGAQEFNSDVIGGSTTVRADDIVVAQLNQNGGRTLTLKVTELTDEFKIDILGYKKTAEGNLVEITNAPVVTFALGVEFQGDVKARRVWYYLCNVTPINEATKTKSESIEANAITLNITVRPIAIDEENYTTHAIASKGDSNYNNFLTTAPELPEVTK